MSVRRMGVDDLACVLGWARNEGWNPGLEDAKAFFAADPQGFFLKEVDGKPVAAVSVVNHDDAFAFLGLYICLPQYRSQGYGLEIWRAALAHAENRCVGLDGVPDQQDNYTRAGFTKVGKTTRYMGRIAPVDPSRLRAASAADTDALIAQDARATGVARHRFSNAWFSETSTRKTLILDGETTAFATYRRCHEGVKIGPLHARTPEQLETLLAGAPASFGAGPLFIDVPDTAKTLRDHLLASGFASTFEAARMYTAKPPKAQPPGFYAVASMELG